MPSKLVIITLRGERPPLNLARQLDSTRTSVKLRLKVDTVLQGCQLKFPRLMSLLSLVEECPGSNGSIN